MGNTYIRWVKDNIGNGEVCICSQKLVADDCSCSGDPHVVPVGIVEILKFVSWM
jgi:hypothetical protein